MLRHSEIWAAIDQLAHAHGMSPSGLARRAGLDPTTFNKSKRVAPDGRPRWPSTESIAKILTASGASLGEFVGFISRDGGVAQRIPLLSLEDAGAPGRFDDLGRPAGEGWDEAVFPGIQDDRAYALEVTGDAYAPVYRDGDMIIVSPRADLRRGDRVVARLKAGTVLARRLVRRTARKVELAPLVVGDAGAVMVVEDLDWMQRIVWASQ